MQRRLVSCNHRRVNALSIVETFDPIDDIELLSPFIKELSALLYAEPGQGQVFNLIFRISDLRFAIVHFHDFKQGTAASFAATPPDHPREPSAPREAHPS